MPQPCLPVAAVVGALLATPPALAAQEAVIRPPYRQHHALTYDPASQKVLLHGGLSRDSGGPREVPPLDDLWSWDGARWTLVASHTGMGMVGHLLFADGAGGLFVTAGAPQAVTARWDRERWSVVTDDTARRRDLAAGAYDSRRRRFVLHGGRAEDRTRAGDTWEFDGTQWRQVATDGPPPRLGASMVYDERRGVVVLFGGRDGARFYGDTWTWDGVRWRQVASSGPEPRISAGMTYDARAGEVVVFGGWDSRQYRGDTWIWGGESWRRVDTPGPPGRADGMMAYDAARGLTVLFGGVAQSGAGMGDTWEFDGRRWIRRD